MQDAYASVIGLFVHKQQVWSDMTLTVAGIVSSQGMVAVSGFKRLIAQQFLNNDVSLGNFRIAEFFIILAE